MNPTRAQVAAGAEAIVTMLLADLSAADPRVTAEMLAAAVLRTVHPRALSLDAQERVRPLIGGVS